MLIILNKILYFSSSISLIIEQFDLIQKNNRFAGESLSLTKANSLSIRNSKIIYFYLPSLFNTVSNIILQSNLVNDFVLIKQK